jgi:hypothetical protein
MTYQSHHQHLIKILKRSVKLFSTFFIIPFSLIAHDNRPVCNDSCDTNAVSELIYPKLVSSFYELRSNQLFWFLPDANSESLRQLLKEKIDSSVNSGLNKEKYHLTDINKYFDDNFLHADSSSAAGVDRIFTDAAIAYCKDMYEGNDINHWMLSDELSSKQETEDNKFLLQGLSNANSREALLVFF